MFILSRVSEISDFANKAYLQGVSENQACEISEKIELEPLSIRKENV